MLTLWAGPYSPAVLRFQISFPSQFPAAAPLITFSSDIFHPLLTPLTTYTHTTSTPDTNTVSASDDERLPPGGFSLRHGFPQWFRRPRDQGTTSRTVSGSTAPSSNVTPQRSSSIPSVTIYQLLDYIRSAFSEESFLNTIPLEAAANPGAYHAWHTHQSLRSNASTEGSQQSSPNSRRSSGYGKSTAASTSPKDSSSSRPRKPGEWNWDGVWEERVKRAVQSSLSEPVLYGVAGSGDDIVSFRSTGGQHMSLILVSTDSIFQYGRRGSAKN
jgi:hypothetical protein